MQINILLKKDYTISWVTNGEEAVNSFLRERPDLILMDIRMPVMNGIQATEKIRTVDIDLPIVAVTANAFLIEQQQALAAGCNDIIAKPYTYERLKETIIYNPQIQISAESETKRSIFREKDKTKRSKKESAQHSKSRNKSFVMTSVSAL